MIGWRFDGLTIDSMVDLGYLDGHNVSASVLISGDGTTIIGDGYHYLVDRRDTQFIWTKSNGRQTIKEWLS